MKQYKIELNQDEIDTLYLISKLIFGEGKYKKSWEKYNKILKLYTTPKYKNGDIGDFVTGGITFNGRE